jgi:hypothetical protein
VQEAVGQLNESKLFSKLLQSLKHGTGISGPPDRETATERVGQGGREGCIALWVGVSDKVSSEAAQHGVRRCVLCRYLSVGGVISEGDTGQGLGNKSPQAQIKPATGR